jgi:hypothetical protein
MRLRASEIGALERVPVRLSQVERLMGTKADARFAFIADKAELASDDLLDL